MLLSMTGYGNGSCSTDHFVLETEIKSLNSRYLDLSVRLPKEISQHEFAVRDYIKNKIIRGKITVSFTITPNITANDEASIEKEELNKAYSILKTIKDETSIEESISINHLLLFKENYLNKKHEDIQIELEDIINALEIALENMILMRSSEGIELKKDLDSRINNINEILSSIEELAKTSSKEYFLKFKEKTKKLYNEFIDDTERFLIELAILSEKHDVTEECIRLHSHIKLFTDTMQNSNDIGRKLNFICQEMNREINTINSKSISSKISHLGINVKEELEKIREQVQNIE